MYVFERVLKVFVRYPPLFFLNRRMSDNIFDFSELRANLLEQLSAKTDETTRRTAIQEYLGKVNKLPSSFVVNDFKKGLEWVNVTEPLSLRTSLKGKLVILDFFTYCCINCMHILPDLKILENEFTIEDGLVVIGVHSPKFSNERETTNVSAAVERYEISHAVVNDPEETMWEALGVCCWPTLIVVGPNGDVLLELMGEGHRELLLLFIDECIKYYEAKGNLSHHPLPQIQPSERTVPSTLKPLQYPGKVIVEHDLIVVADTGHHRIVILDTSGNVKHIVGGPDAGFCDGTFSEAKFHALQGVAFYSPSILFVADTENHAIREVNLSTGLVKTVVGTGDQGHDRLGGKLWTDQAISSPWDLCIIKEHVLLIAMAGTHQLWALFLEDTDWWKNKKYGKGVCAAIAGSGREENRNNSYPMSAAFAQPSGLCFAPNLDSVFVADSESSTVRKLQIHDGQVLSVVGGAIDPRNLFGFGDIDGKGVEVKLQHPLGVAWSDSNKIVYVADTYNHKVKCIEPISKQCTTLTDANNKPFKFNEPGGLFVVNDNLYVADTNNHQIIIVNLKTKTSEKLAVHLQSDLTTSENKVIPVVCEETVNFPQQGGDLNVKISLSLPNGTSLTPGAPSRWNISLPPGYSWLNTVGFGSGDNFRTKQDWNIKVAKLNGVKETVKIDCYVFYCIRDVCSSKRIAFNVNLNPVDNRSGSETVTCNLNYSMK